MTSIGRAVAVLMPLALLASPVGAAPPKPAPLVFFDVAGLDGAGQAAFYREVFGWKVGADGRFVLPTTGAVLPGALRTDPAGKGLYIGVDDVTATLAQVVAHGGRVITPRFEVKGTVILGLFSDPAGNAMGLVERKDGMPKLP